MKKILLAALFLTLGFAGLALAVCDSRVQTCLTALDVSGAASVGSLTNTGPSTLTGTVSVSSITLSGTQGIVFQGVITSSGTTTPLANHALAIGNSNILIISTASAIGSWVSVGSQ